MFCYAKCKYFDVFHFLEFILFVFSLPQLDVIASNLLVDIQQELVGHQPEQSLIMMELFLDEMLLVVKGMCMSFCLL